jgi:hypothetical protein
MLLLMTCVWIIAQSQDNSGVKVKSGGKYFVGLTYSYLSADLSLESMTRHSVWAGQDFGTVELDQGEIDTINSYMDYKEQFHDLNLAVGMVLLNKPGKPWYIDVRLEFGLFRRMNSIINTAVDTGNLKITSEHFSPSFKLGFDFRYGFSDRWKLALDVKSLYALGSNQEIDQNIFPVVESMDESKENRFNMSYTSVDLLASCTIKNITLYAGPGFYLLYNKNKYQIVRTSQQDGKTYEDIIKTSTRTRNFINGNVRIDWKISDHFVVGAGAGISNDISANAGVIYFF